MKNLLYIFLLCFGLSSAANAAPGDTTWVQSHAGTQLSWYGDYDTTVTFPAGPTSYRKIYMVFTLGKYVCPGSPQYCADWDYTVQTLLMTPAGDTLELGRLITPYAKGPRMPPSWKGVYMFDVTDYYPVLKNTGTVRLHYSGYSGGFTADVKFAFIEGTPPRDVLGITRVWKGSYNYGHGSTPINDALSNVSLTAPANTQTAEAKFTITGHGGDAQNCAEFCPNTYTFNLNNNMLVQQNFWQDDCGFNNYYPQSGTWIYDRAGWCPGDLVNTYSHTLTGITANSNYTINATFPSYVSNPSSSGSKASYIIEAAVIYYGGFNKTLDASLDDIIAPTNFEAHFRSNPRVGHPIVRVKNTGSTPLTSIKLEYGVTGHWMPDYTWTGTLAPLEETDITLPEPWSLRTATGTNTFAARILEVNGQNDNDSTNNSLTSTFTAAPKWPVNLAIELKTNNSTANGVSESSWVILDMNGDTVAERRNNAAGTTYNDTVLLGPAVYQLVVNDEGCNGLSWWANPGGGTGHIKVTRATSLLPLPLSGYFGGDFGCGFSQYFTTDWPTGVAAVSSGAGISIEAYPNPATEVFTVQLSGLKELDGVLTVIDALGKLVHSQPCKEQTVQISTANLSNGLYTVAYTEAGKGKVQTRIMIAK